MSWDKLIYENISDICRGYQKHWGTLAWKIPWTEEPGRLQSIGSHRVRLDWATSISFFTFMHWRKKWQPTPVFLPGESQGRGAWWAAVYGVAQSQTRLKRLSSSSRHMHSQRFHDSICCYFSTLCIWVSTTNNNEIFFVQNVKDYFNIS